MRRGWLVAVPGLLACGVAHAESHWAGPKPSAGVPVGGMAGVQSSIAQAMGVNGSVPWSIVVGLTLLTLIPALLLAMTPMVRLLVVFHFLRQALGTQTAPSNQVLMGLALMMTWFLMQPVLSEVEKTATAPYRAGEISGEVALERGVVPVKRYLLKYAREKDLAVFASAGMVERPKTKDDLPFQVVVPAYMLSELKAGFQIGAVLFLPFLLIDLVIASVTTSIGMMQLPPVVISIPTERAPPWCLEQADCAGLLVIPGEDGFIVAMDQLHSFYRGWRTDRESLTTGFWIPNLTTEEEDFWQEHGL